MKRMCVIALLLIASTANAATEKWFDAYARGVKAVNAKSYAAAADALQKAIAETPNEGVNVRAGNSLITYVPHFWLGIAKFNLGDVDGALRAWSTSEQQGVISRTEYYAGMKDWIARAQTEKVRKAESAAKGSKSQADTAINSAIKAQVEAVKDGGDRADSYRAAQRKLQEALGQFNKAGTNIDAYKTAEETATQARALFARASEEGKAAKLARLNAPKPQPPAQRAPVQQPVQQPVPQPARQAVAQPVQQATVIPPPQKQAEAVLPMAEQPKSPIEKPAPATPKIEEPAAESEASVAARVAFQKYRTTASRLAHDDRGEAKEADRLRQRLERAKGNDAELQRIAREAEQRERTLVERSTAKPLIEPQPRDAREGLQHAYRAYAAGDLTVSEQLLSKLVTDAPSAEAFLLRGCARYTRAMLSRTPEAHLAEAANDFRAALARDAKLRLDARAFSPKLIAFFEKVRGAR